MSDEPPLIVITSDCTRVQIPCTLEAHGFKEAPVVQQSSHTLGYRDVVDKWHHNCDIYTLTNTKL